MNENKQEQKGKNLSKEFVIKEFEKGCCQARYKGDDSYTCKNKAEPGKICCSDHLPLTQQDKKIKLESKSSSYSTSESDSVKTESLNQSNNRCVYIKSNGQCKELAVIGKFCKKCHKVHTDETSIRQSNNYCTIILDSGPNRNRVCGKKCYDKNLHICLTHYPKEKIEKCDFIKNGHQCGATVKHPHGKKCGKHVNCLSMVKYQPEPERIKSDEEIAYENYKNRIIPTCNMPCKNGSLCSSKAEYGIKLKNEVTGGTFVRPVCLMHHNKHNKDSLKEKTHRCAATYESGPNKGRQCVNCSVPEGYSYCGRHESYEPKERCGAFDFNTLDRCTTLCKEGQTFCRCHKNYDADPIQCENDVDFIRGQIYMQQLQYMITNYTVVCIDPPKKKLRIKIVEDKTINKLSITEGYGLDCFVSNSEEESDATEKSEEIVKVEAVPKKVWSLVPDEFELIHKATGWTEDQIRIMKNKRIFKRVLGPKKQFNLEKTLFESRKGLELYFTRAINEANGKYNSAKTTLSNVIRDTFSDLSASVENVIGLFGVQRFSAREKALPDCKNAIKILNSIQSVYNKRIENLPVPVTKKKLVDMDIDKYIAAFNDVKHTVTKEMKEDIKYIKEFQKFADGAPKKYRSDYEASEDKRETKEAFKAKYIAYFEKYIVRFAKVALHKENLKGRMFGFANYFIDLLNEKRLDYTKFRNAYNAGELVNEEDGKAFYCDMFTIISNIINKHAGMNVTIDGKPMMDYLDVDISFNLSSSEHQTEFSEELRECKRLGKPRAGAKSMLDVGEVQRFKAKIGFSDYENNYEMDEYAVSEFKRGIPGYGRNLLKEAVIRNNWPMNDYIPEEAPKIPRWVNINGIMVPEEIENEFKPSFSNNVVEILGIDV